MASFPCVHHIEIGAIDGPEAVDILTSKFNFKVTAVRQTAAADQWLVSKNNARFLITCLKTSDAEQIKNDSYVTNWSHQPLATERLTLPRKTSVFNVAFQVKNIEACLKRLNQQNVTFIKPLQTVQDGDSFVRSCVIKSCIGDIQHTLIERTNYHGSFLPGFTEIIDNSVISNDSDEESVIENIDHVAFAVDTCTSVPVIEWYEKCFGMKRFLINRDEDEDNGLMLSTNDVGLRLRAMEYWKCAEVGLMSPEEEGIESKLSVVLCESLPPVPGSKEVSQIEEWLRQHGGPGIQHIALTTNNIKHSVKRLRKLGVPFANPPPPAYYSEAGRLGDIIRAGENADELKDSSILIDTEADGIHDCKKGPDIIPKQESYLLQIFTRPVFSDDPFFVEFIQRKGATGFGSGNVAALYRSVQAFIVGQKSN